MLTPEEMAEEFWEMDSDEQARFFSRLAEVATCVGLPLQLQAITLDDDLTAGGRAVMKLMGTFA